MISTLVLSMNQSQAAFPQSSALECDQISILFALKSNQSIFGNSTPNPTQMFADYLHCLYNYCFMIFIYRPQDIVLSFYWSLA